MLALAIYPANLRASSTPVPPCTSNGSAINPAYGPVDNPPTVGIWRDIDLKADDCLGQTHGHMQHVITLAGRFEHTGTVEDLAARIGAISSTAGAMYWSVTEDQWRPLISEAFALEDPIVIVPRREFTAREILSGKKLYLAQNDTRSIGFNVYSQTVRVLGPDRLAIEIVNLSDIRFLLVRMFEAKALASVHLIERLHENIWGYYGLSTIRQGAMEGHEKSFVNRAAAYYRFLIGDPTDKEPPLAP